MSQEIFLALMRALPPEAAHRCALEALRLARALRWPLPGGPIPSGRPIECMGLTFQNPLGLAAGFDKSGDFVDALGALGFGFLEVGTVTPRAQRGNARPRIFRLPRETALINQMGSPNKGIAHLVAKIRERSYTGVLGVNIGKNADTPLAHAVDDYTASYRAVRSHADYVALNVSSPNTPGLRELQDDVYLREILMALVRERNEVERGSRILVKLSPDLSPESLDAASATVLGCGIDGVIATNSTVSRDGMELRDPRLEKGGLSGRPLHGKSVAMIRALRERLGGRVTIIGVGGILSASTALETLAAGANLIQIYTGLVYRGPKLIADIVGSTGGPALN